MQTIHVTNGWSQEFDQASIHVPDGELSFLKCYMRPDRRWICWDDREKDQAH